MELSAFTNLFSDLQAYVAGILNNDEVLQEMGAHFLAENQLDIEFEAKNALSKQGLACLVMTPQAKYQGHNTIQQTFTCEELTLQIVENPPVNRARLKKEDKKFGTALDVAKAASDRLAGPQGGYFGKFTTKEIRESEQAGLLVCTVTFGCTVYEKLDAVISGDLSGHWVEVPFVRIDDLSSWLSTWISGHMPDISVDTSALREKVDLSAYKQYNGYAPWTSETSAVFNWTSGTTWSSDTGWNLEWLSAMNVWQLTREEPPAYPIFDLLSDALSIPVPLDLQEQFGQTLIREYVYKEGIQPINDYLVLSSQISADYTNDEIDYKIEKSRQNLDLSVYTNVVRWPWTFYAGNFSPTDENTWEWGHHVLRWTEEDGWKLGYWEETYDEETGESTTVWYDEGEIVEGKYSKYTLELKVTGFMGVDETVISRTQIDHYISEGEMLATTGMLDQYRAKNDLSVYDISFKPWTSETGITLQWQGAQYGRYDWQTPHQQGEDYYSISRPEVATESTTTWYLYMLKNGRGYAQNIIASPNATQLEITNAELTTYFGTWIKRTDDIPSFSISNPKDRIMLSSNLSSYLDEDSWPMRTLSAEYDENCVRIRTYDGIDHYVDLSSMANYIDFNRYGFTYDDDPLSGMMELAIPHLRHSQTVNLYQSKIKRIWIPSDVVDIRPGFCNTLPELETVLLYDYTPGNFSKTLRLNVRSFNNCPKLRRVELPALSVTWPPNINVDRIFDGSPLSGEDPVRPDIKPGLWLYGYLSGETHARQNLSVLMDPDKIHVADILGQSGSGSSGEYLPLSGGSIDGNLSVAGMLSAGQLIGNSGNIICNYQNIAQGISSIVSLGVGTGDTVEVGRLDNGIRIPRYDGFRTVATQNDISSMWKKSDMQLSVGNSGFKSYVDPGAFTSERDTTTQITKTEYLWDGVTYILSASGGTPVNHVLRWPEAGGTFATQQWANSQLSTRVVNANGISAMLSATYFDWQSISADANPNMLYVVVEEN